MQAPCSGCGRFFKSVTKHQKKARCGLPVAVQPPEPTCGPEDDQENLKSYHQANMMRAAASKVLQHLRYDKQMPDAMLDELKPAMARNRAIENGVLRDRIAPLLAPGNEAELDKALAAVADPFHGLKTAKLERAYALKTEKLPYLEPRVRDLRKKGASIGSKEMKKHGTVGFSVIELLTRVLQNDPQLCDEIIATSDRWMTGEHHEVPAESFADQEDGEMMRSHPHVMRKATPEELAAQVVRVGLQLYKDRKSVV